MGHTGCESIDRGELGWELPELPRDIVGFEQPLEKLKAKVLANNDNIDINNININIDDDDGFDAGTVVVVSAAGGCGKTILATMLCYDPQIKDKFGESIFYVTATETANFMVIVNELINPYSYGQNIPFRSNKDAKNTLHKFLCEKVSGPILVVLDDVWSDSFIKNFAFKMRGYKVVVTSRMLYPKYDLFLLGPLSDEDAKTIFVHAAFSRTPNPSIENDVVNQIVKCCKRHPHTLSAVGSHLKKKDAIIWRGMLRELSQGRPVIDVDKEVYMGLERSFEALNDELKECYLDFGLFPEDERIAASSLLDLWVHLYNHDDEGYYTLEKILQLYQRNLVTILTTNGTGSVSSFNHCEYQFVRQHGLLRELAIQLSSKGPVAKRERLIIHARGEHLPGSIIKVKEPMQARIMSISTGESFPRAGAT